MHILESIEALRNVRRDLKGKVGLVPTMGYLHVGHLALVKAAREMCDSVVATIFVNPTQFDEGEDLTTYPRDLARDINLFDEGGVDAVFIPTPAMMYPPHFQTWVTVEEVTLGREGGKRPSHFRGVTTVVCKLFNLVQADVAFFGQKDAQQVIVIRQMVRDLNIPVEMQVHPIVRENDGLALSSRNVYLDEKQRLAATVLYKALQAVGVLYEKGERDPKKLRAAAAAIINDEPLAKLDYVSLADAQSFVEVDEATNEPLLLSLAAQVGKPRLLDNCLLPLLLNTLEGATATLGRKS